MTPTQTAQSLVEEILRLMGWRIPVDPALKRLRPKTTALRPAWATYRFLGNPALSRTAILRSNKEKEKEVLGGGGGGGAGGRGSGGVEQRLSNINLADVRSANRFLVLTSVIGTRSYLRHKLSRVKRHLVQVGSRGSQTGQYPPLTALSAPEAMACSCGAVHRTRSFLRKGQCMYK